MASERQSEAKEELKRLLASGDLGAVVMVSEWDDVTRENGWDIDALTVREVVDSPLVQDFDQDGDYFFATGYDGCDIVMTQCGDDVATLPY